MKNFLILTTLLFSLCVNAQLGLGKGTLYNKAVVYFIDGSTEKGVIKRRPLGGVKFRENMDAKPNSYDSSDIIGYDDLIENEKYRYKTVDGFTKLMKIELLGELNLFSIYKKGGTTQTIMPGSIQRMPMNVSYEGRNVYYLEKNEKVINVGERIAKNEWYLFENCSILIDKIKHKEINKGSIKEIVDFYNNKCK